MGREKIKPSPPITKPEVKIPDYGGFSWVDFSKVVSKNVIVKCDYCKEAIEKGYLFENGLGASSEICTKCMDEKFISQNQEPPVPK